MILPVYDRKKKAFFFEMDGDPKVRERISDEAFAALYAACLRANRDAGRPIVQPAPFGPSVTLEGGRATLNASYFDGIRDMAGTLKYPLHRKVAVLLIQELAKALYSDIE